jgi:hypothetical protein
MKKCLLIISLLFAATANAAEEVDSRLGAFHTVASLVEMCTSPNPASLRYCYGYVTAVADTINSAATTQRTRPQTQTASPRR